MKALLVLSFLALAACNGKKVETLTITPPVLKKWQSPSTQLFLDMSGLSDYGIGEVLITDTYNYECRFDSEVIGNDRNGSVLLKSVTQSTSSICDDYLGQYYYNFTDIGIELCDLNTCTEFH